MPSPNQVMLIKVAGGADHPVTIWDVVTRQSRIRLGDVRKLTDTQGGNPYMVSIAGRVEIVGGYPSRIEAVAAVVEAARDEVARAQP